MESTLHALGGILLNAIPTFLLIIFLHFYLKAVFFKPLAKVLQEREEATTGARKRAEEALARAEEKSRQYEETLRDLRNRIYQEQEEQRRQWRIEQDRQVAEATEASRRLVAEARARLTEEVGAARQLLDAQARELAGQIAETILQRRPS